MRELVHHLRGASVAIAIVLAALARPAAAQQVDVEATATVDVGFAQTSRSAFVPDPNGMAVDMPGDTQSRLFMEIRPGIMLQTGSPRLMWRAGYLFAGTLAIAGDQLSAYSNAANGQLAAQLTPLTNLTLTTDLAQGGTSFLLTTQPADAAQPQFRAPGNGNQITAALAESLVSQLGKHLSLQQTAGAGFSAPQDAIGERNVTVSAGVGLDRNFERDGIGAELRSSVAWLQPLRAQLGAYQSYTSSLSAHWNHDFSLGWNGTVSAGVEQVFIDAGSRPVAFLPAGSASLRYALREDIGGGIDFSHGTATNLQVGSVSITDRVSVHGNYALDSRIGRAVAFSAGFLHNAPLGQVASLVAAGTGNVVQVDAGFTTLLAKNIQGVARYSLSYQYDQGANLPPALANIFFVGVSGTIRNTERPMRGVPVRGHRVDGNDSWGLAPADTEPTPPSASAAEPP
ncbi:MAG TPA: hypothetical protein VGD37_31620 [Kofleriaceae bacterium]